jgi:hypothetical protein
MQLAYYFTGAEGVIVCNGSTSTSTSFLEYELQVQTVVVAMVAVSLYDNSANTLVKAAHHCLRASRKKRHDAPFNKNTNQPSEPSPEYRMLIKKWLNNAAGHNFD